MRMDVWISNHLQKKTFVNNLQKEVQIEIPNHVETSLALSKKNLTNKCESNAPGFLQEQKSTGPFFAVQYLYELFIIVIFKGLESTTRQANI